MQIFNEIKVEFDTSKLASCMCLNSDMDEYREFQDLVTAIKAIATPQALLAEAKIIDKNDHKL